MAIRKFEAPNGVKGFVEKEGIFDPKWVVYKDKFFGNQKVGSVEPKEDKLREYLEKTFGRPVKIWWKFLRSVFPLEFFYKKVKISETI